MLVRGKLISVTPSLDKEGNQRTFEGRDGKKYKSYDVEIDIPGTRKDGTEFNDELIVECNVPMENRTPYEPYIGTDTIYDITIFASRREYNGRKFLSLRLSTITQRME